ncbi:MAG: Histidine kinase [Chthoniobacteraceae bacterium]|nr:Histidine kinase [Chthoniobacteraceae bacterium]
MPNAAANAVATLSGQVNIWRALECVKDFAILTLDAGGLVTLWNTGAECLFGYTAGEILGKPAAILFTPEDRAANAPEQELDTAREKGIALDERWHQRKDGSRFFASGKLTPFHDEAGSPGGFTKVCQDLTEELRRRQILEQSEERYRVLVELSPQGVWFGRADGFITFCNQHWINLTGLSLEETEGDGWLRAIAQEDRERVLGVWQEAVRTGRETEVEMPVRTRHGNFRWYLARAKPVRDENGDVRHWIGIAIDIHDRKLAEFAEASFRVLFESAPSLYLVLTPDDYTIAAVSESYLQATMTDRASIIHQRMFNVFPDNPEHPEIQGVKDLTASFERVKAFRRADVMPVQRYPIRRPPKQAGGFEDRWWSIFNSPVFGENGEIVYIIHRAEDVTEYIQGKEGLQSKQMIQIHYEHMQAEIVLHAREFQRLNQQLIQSEQQYRAMFESASVGMVQASSKDGRFLQVNTTFCNITGYPMQELLTMRSYDLTHPEERDADWEAYQRAVRQETSHYLSEKRYIRKDKQVVWVRVSAAFVRDTDQQAAHSFAVVEEITARKEAEFALREADRRKTEFLAMLAHELRNPLGAVCTAVQACREERSQKIYEWGLAIVARQTCQLTHLVDDLLDVSRITLGMIRLHKERVDAAVLLDHAVEAARPLINKHRHELFLSYDRSGTGLPLEADAARLEQIVLNLLTNAAKYTDEGGRIELSARLEAETIVILVRDNGMGVAPEKIASLFELFAQGERDMARSEGGLGIGLAIVKRLTEMHGGSITASSQGPGHGSQFTIRLPAAKPAPSPHPSPANQIEARSSAASTRILIVEDNKDTAEGMARLLQRRGYSVELAYDGLAGLAAARSSSPNFVLLDIGLPGRDGYQVAASLRNDAAYSHMILIAISGYGQEEDRARSRAAGFDHHLTKPLNFTELEQLLSSHS